MRRLLLGAGLLLASLVAWADVPPIPALTARVTDLTATLSGDQRQHLEQQLAALEAKSGAQLAVLLVPTHPKATCSVFCLPRAQSRAAMGFLPLGCTRVSSTA